MTGKNLTTDDKVEHILKSISQYKDIVNGVRHPTLTAFLKGEKRSLYNRIAKFENNFHDSLYNAKLPMEGDYNKDSVGVINRAYRNSCSINQVLNAMIVQTQAEIISTVSAGQDHLFSLN